MKLILCDNYEEISLEAARIVAQQLKEKTDSVLGLATGSTPLGLYKELIRMNENGEIDFSKVKTFNLDEYYPLSADNEQSYHYFMNENLFSKINIDINNTYIPDGMAANPEKECRNFESKINENGGIDLQILGIGQNGHIGFNEPEMKLVAKTHLTDLTENTVSVNSRFFDSIDEVPKQALTMGIGTILATKKIVLLASGANKHRALAALLKGDINTDIPATMLNLHPDVTVICDRNAYSCARIGVDIGGTDIKFGVMNYKDQIVYKDSIPTNFETAEALVSAVADKCFEIMEQYPISGIGVGTPGGIRNGYVTAGNLPFKNTPLGEMLRKKIDLSVMIGNDANCAALGEAMCGSGKDHRHLVLITLGTGVGGGIVIDGNIYTGRGSAGEIGHFCIERDGLDCGCGNKGCWEQYASASALCRNAEKAACENEESILGEIYRKNGKINGKLFFDALDRDCPVAKAVFDEYIDVLVLGLNGIDRIFDPDVIVLAGGITHAGDKLLKPLTDKLRPGICVKISELKNDAGICGAALLQ